MNKSELIEKIRKLLALSDSSNPNEAALALSRAQKLIEKYNIETSELQANNGIGEIKLKPLSSMSTQTTASLMLSIIKKAFGVDTIILTTNSRVTTIVLVGPEELLESCDYIFTVLSRHADKAIKDYAKIVEAEVLIDSYQNESFIESVKKYVPVFYRKVYEPLMSTINAQADNQLIKNEQLYNDYLKNLSRLFRAYRNEAYEDLSYGRVSKLKKIYSSMVRDKKKWFYKRLFQLYRKEHFLLPAKSGS